MTTFFNFQPPAQSNFQFEPTLDGNPYAAVVPWLLFGQRWYLALFSLNGVLIFYRSLIGSPPGLDIQTIGWEGDGYVAVTTSMPVPYQIGQTINLTISGCSPDAYNGTFPCLITGPDSFIYPLAGNPGAVTALGRAAYNINLAWGYFQQSSLVYRPATQQFEVSP